MPPTLFWDDDAADDDADDDDDDDVDDADDDDVDDDDDFVANYEHQGVKLQKCNKLTRIMPKKHEFIWI